MSTIGANAVTTGLSLPVAKSITIPIGVYDTAVLSAFAIVCECKYHFEWYSRLENGHPIMFIIYKLLRFYFFETTTPIITKTHKHKDALDTDEISVVTSSTIVKYSE